MELSSPGFYTSNISRVMFFLSTDFFFHSSLSVYLPIYNDDLDNNKTERLS
jgi:hypothetical protein